MEQKVDIAVRLWKLVREMQGSLDLLEDMLRTEVLKIPTDAMPTYVKATSEEQS